LCQVEPLRVPVRPIDKDPLHHALLQRVWPTNTLVRPRHRKDAADEPKAEALSIGTVLPRAIEVEVISGGMVGGAGDTGKKPAHREGDYAV